MIYDYKHIAIYSFHDINQINKKEIISSSKLTSKLQICGFNSYKPLQM